MIAQRIISILIGYVFGLFQTGYIYGKLHRVDIREHGSGNAGTTNTLRTLGWKAGLITFIGDLSKAILALFVTWLIFHKSQLAGVHVLMQYAGLGAILGHNYPIYLGFKGGKGIACTAGFILAFCPIMAPACLALFIFAVLVTRYVSLGSIIVVVMFLAQLFVFGNLGLLPVPNGFLPEVYTLGIIMTILALVKHKANIVRLLDGTESKLDFKKIGKED
ncbi:MAG: glycerol-3-phosphate 1-O-acyltransferase PlsY [Lachnospiraceae bacterium]